MEGQTEKVRHVEELMDNLENIQETFEMLLEQIIAELKSAAAEYDLTSRPMSQSQPVALAETLAQPMQPADGQPCDPARNN